MCNLKAVCAFHCKCMLIAEYMDRTFSDDTVLDDADASITYSDNWDSSSNNFSQFYFLNTMQ